MALVLDDVDFKIDWGSYVIKVNNFIYGNKEYTTNHNHNSIELHIILCGKINMTINSVKTYNLEPGDFVILGKGVFHEEKVSDFVYGISINFEIIRKSNDISEYDSIIKIFDSLDFHKGNDKSILVLFEQIKMQLENKHLGYFTYCKHLISLVIMEASQVIDNRKCNDYVPTKNIYDRETMIIDHYFANILTGLFPNPSPSDLANKIMVSERQLNRIIRKRYNKSFREMMIDVKLENVKHLIINTDYTNSKIAEIYGASVRHLEQEFKRKYGKTIFQFRKINQKTINHINSNNY